MSDIPHCVVPVRNILGEGPVWDAREQVLYWVDITGKILHQYTPGTNNLRTWDVPDEFSSYALRETEPGIISGTRDGFCFYDPATEAFEMFAFPEKPLPSNRMNDGKCDPRGRFWCGSIHEVSDPSLRQPIASMYRVDPDRTVTKVRGGIKTSNGFAWSPDGRTMYFTDTPTLKILAFDYDLDSGTLSNERVFATVPPGNGRPDGAAVDVEGCVWSAHFAGWKVTRYSPAGEILKVLDLPVANVTSCAFGGHDMSTLFITTANEDLTEEELKQQPLAGGLFAFEAGVRGVPVHRFAG
jgi:sugar lactone lactonase YvrE